MKRSAISDQHSARSASRSAASAPATLVEDPPRRAVSRVRAFTLTEMMVAVAVLVVVIIATSKIFGTASQITGIGHATQSVIQEAAAIERQIRADIAQLSREGFFAIRCVAVRNDINGAVLLNPNLPPNAVIRADQILFFRDGVGSMHNFRLGEFQDTKGQGTVARVYYGPAFQLREAQPVILSNPNGTEATAHDPAAVSVAPNPGASQWYPWSTGTLAMRRTKFMVTFGGPGIDAYSTTAAGTINGAQPEARQWLLVRQPIVLVDDDQNAGNTNHKTVYLQNNLTARSIFMDGIPWLNANLGWSRQVRDGRVDGAATSQAEIRYWVTVIASIVSPFTPRNWRDGSITPLLGGDQRTVISKALFYPRAERNPPGMHRIDQALTNHVISSGCSSFTVDWTYDTGTGAAPGYAGVGIDRRREQTWFGLADTFPIIINGNAERGIRAYSDAYQSPPIIGLPFSGAATIVPADIENAYLIPSPGPDDPQVYEAFFGYNHSQPVDPATGLRWNDPSSASYTPTPNSYTPWPTAIRITMTLHDPDGKLEGGREFQFVIDLPKRN